MPMSRAQLGLHVDRTWGNARIGPSFSFVCQGSQAVISVAASVALHKHLLTGMQSEIPLLLRARPIRLLMSFPASANSSRLNRLQRTRMHHCHTGGLSYIRCPFSSASAKKHKLAQRVRSHTCVGNMSMSALLQASTGRALAHAYKHT
eukprot:15462816-Alexandrium_andersonii.AAC.1